MDDKKYNVYDDIVLYSFNKIFICAKEAGCMAFDEFDIHNTDHLYLLDIAKQVRLMTNLTISVPCNLWTRFKLKLRCGRAIGRLYNFDAGRKAIKTAEILASIQNYANNYADNFDLYEISREYYERKKK